MVPYWHDPAYVGPVQEMYSEDRRVWNAIFEIVSQNLSHAETHGVQVGGEAGVIWPIILGNKGDWSYLVLWSGVRISFFLEGKVEESNTKDV